MSRSQSEKIRIRKCSFQVVKKKGERNEIKKWQNNRKKITIKNNYIGIESRKTLQIIIKKMIRDSREGREREREV